MGVKGADRKTDRQTDWQLGITRDTVRIIVQIHGLNLQCQNKGKWDKDRKVKINTCDEAKQ